MRAILILTLTLIFFGSGVFAGGHSSTLQEVKERGKVRCVVSTGLAGFAAPDANGVWTGFDIDFCRATAAAIFGDADAFEAVPATTANRFTVLNSGEGDVLWRNTTITFSRDVSIKMRFHGVNYYDGQGFMVRKDLGVKSAKELDGASVCIQTGTTTELNLSDFFEVNGMSYEAIPIATNDEARICYDSGRGDVYTTDVSGLASTRPTLKDPSAHIILPEVISKEPLGPATRHGDDQWSDIITWVLNATITAEELGVTSQNVDQMKSSSNKEVLRMLGVEGSQGQEFGLSNDWAYQIIKQIGNYGEIFERHIGLNTPVGLPRGVNELWTKGGLMYSPPFR